MKSKKENISYKGSIVLVHGAGVGGWVFRDLATLLRMFGYLVLTPTFTGLGERVHLLTKEISMETHIQDIINCIEKNGLNDVVILGHSYGAAISSVVVDRIPEKIKKQIYLDGFILENGESIVDVFGKDREQELLKIVEIEGEGWYLPKRLFGKDHPLILNTPFLPYLIKADITGKRDKIPGYFINCINPVHFEQLIEPKKLMKKRCLDRDWNVLSLDSDHAPMTKSPEREQLVDMILKILEE